MSFLEDKLQKMEINNYEDQDNKHHRDYTEYDTDEFLPIPSITLTTGETINRLPNAPSVLDDICLSKPPSVLDDICLSKPPCVLDDICSPTGVRTVGFSLSIHSVADKSFSSGSGSSSGSGANPKQGILRYDLSVLLNFIPEDHFYRQKTKKIYKGYYHIQGFSGSLTSNSKRKSYLVETEVFSDERSIQEIRGILGKMSHANKQDIIDTLKKNKVSPNSYNILIQLLHQYATLCIEWNDLYLSIYDKVYYQSDSSFYEKLFELSKDLIKNPREYDDPEQKMFFRISNIELYCKLGFLYSSYRKDTTINWGFRNIQDIYDKFLETKTNDWLIIIVHFLVTLFKNMQTADKKSFKKNIALQTWFKEIQQMVDSEIIPIKIRFKWMDFIDLINI
jgi:hypothetical protein